MIELSMRLNGCFTDTDKEKCVPVIQGLVELANLVRMRGVLVLEAEARQQQSVFLKTALLLVVDGTDPDIVKQILQNLILADGYSGSQLLERLLYAEGVLAIQKGENPFIIEKKLSSMLGEKYMSAAKENDRGASEKIKGYIDFLRSLNSKTPLHESKSFESILINMDNRSLQHVIRSVDFRDLTLALYGCGFSVVYKALENVSLDTCLQIRDSWEHYEYLCSEDIIRAQERITGAYKALVSRGEIISISDLS